MTWDGFRGTLQWMLVLLLIGVIAAGAFGMHLWMQKDQLVHQFVEERLQALFETCHVEFEQVQIPDTAHVVITELTLLSKADDSLLVTVPRLTIHIDGDVLQQSRRVLVKQLEVESPQLFAFRDESGRWNWEGFRFKKSSQNYSPSINLKNGRVRIGLRSVPGGPVHSIDADAVQVAVSPEAKQRYAIEGQANIDSLGSVSLTGLLNSQTGNWELAGNAGQFRIDEPLLNRTGQWIPEVGEKLAQLKNSPQYLAKQESKFRTASNKKTEVGPLSEEAESFLRADVALTFSCGQLNADSPIDYRVQANIAHGQVSDLFLPIPLYDVHADIELTPDRIKVDRFRASNNKSSLFLDGEANRVESNWGRRFVVKASNLQIDERIQSILPEDILHQYQLIRPSGTFDLDFEIVQEPGQDWSGVLRKFTAVDCRVEHDFFRYPVTGVNGEITHQNDRFVLTMQGKAGQQPVKVEGTLGKGQLGIESDFTVDVANLPVDDKFIAAFARQEVRGVRSALKSLRLQGVADLRARFVKNDATAGDLKMMINANVRDGAANFINFPYELEGFGGKISYNSFRDKIWRFSELKARHGHALLIGNGTFDATTSPGLLALDIGAVRVPLDADLEKASLIAQPQLETLWRDFSLAGTTDIENIGIRWEPGTPTQLTLRGIQWKDGRIKPAVFPYQWDDVVGSLEWTGKRLKIHSLHGWHGETYLELNGSDPDWPSFIELPDEGEVAWEVHFGNMRIVKARIDDELIRALPTDMATAAKSSNLEGTVDVQLRVDMRGWHANSRVVTANWEMLTVLDGNSLFAGTQLDNVTGKVNIRDGIWDGQHLRLEGTLDLKQAVALGMPFTNLRGPFHLDQSRVVIGTPKFIDPPVQFRKPNDYEGKQLRAEIYGGQIGHDALVLLGARPELTQYRSEINVNDVELAEWAADQAPQTRRLKGKINGLMACRGIGTSPEAIEGKGWINIVPAAIMELPAFAQMFALINFQPVGDTAFNYAYADFEIRNGRFEFSKIELRGDALGLIGKGVVGFAAGAQSLINLTFDSRTNNRLPVIGRLIEGLGSNWIRVQVTGTVDQPVPIIQPRIGPLDDAFREFQDALEKGQSIRPPVRMGSAK